ncbi:DUF6896 domain-containing protein [Kibdelosporangium lantanae]|uniref:DUF6896 domain-containing protein n=1 Tax=Kibdelosporangium lantanae TaxID=1497396 RepID=A0ABW3M1Z3_9PSEU
MSPKLRDAVEIALLSFAAGKASIEETFGVRGANQVVRAVLTGSRPRRGRCLDGREYFIHGIGYTVVFFDDGQVHIDGDVDDNDVFSSYDVSFFLKTSGIETVSDREIRPLLDDLVDSGRLRINQRRKYIVHSISN